MKTKRDRRVDRTIDSLHAALFDLILERRYESVSVQHILDRSGVARSTFYVHFRDKEELLKSSFENLHGDLARQLQPAVSPGPKAPEELAFVLPLLQHIDDHRELYLATIGQDSGAVIHRQMSALLSELVRSDLVARQGSPRPKVEFDAAVQFVTGAFLAMTMRWLCSEKPLSPEAMNRVFRDLALPGLQAVFAR